MKSKRLIYFIFHSIFLTETEGLVNPKCYPRAIGGRCGLFAFDCDPELSKQICIPITSVRNCVRDCANGSDELCGDGEMLCDTYPGQCGRCVPSADVQRLCADQKYIRLCEEADTVKCAHTKNCVFIKWLADGQDDCGDASDENPCEKGLIDCEESSTSGQYPSRSTLISTIYASTLSTTTTKILSTTSTASNLSISIDVSKPCPPANFRCNSGKCIPYSSIFDGKNDCGDNSDENYCTVEEDSCPVNRPCSFQPDVGSFGCGCPHGWNRTEAGMCWEMTTTSVPRRSTQSIHSTVPPTVRPASPTIPRPIQALVQHATTRP